MLLGVQAESQWSKALQSVGVLLSPSFSLAAFGGDTLTVSLPSSGRPASYKCQGGLDLAPAALGPKQCLKKGAFGN